MPHSILFNEQTASEMIGLKVATLRKRRWQGLPPKFLKVGSKVFYKQEDLQKFLDNCERLSTSDKGSNHEK
jgi:hypothetical protein